MPDREKVIKGLENCAKRRCNSDCPYFNVPITNGSCILAVQADALAMLKEQVQEPIVHCKDCKYGLYTGTEYHCDKHSGHENRLGEDQYYKEWHNGNWFCADAERQ